MPRLGEPMMTDDTSYSNSPADYGPWVFPSRAELLQTILDSLTHPFYVIDVETHQVCLANRTVHRPYPGDSPLCHVLVHGRAQPCAGRDHPCPLELVLETGRPAVLEHIHRDGDGTCRYSEVHAFPLRDEAGRITHVIEYCIDITEHKRIVQQHDWEVTVNKAIADVADALIDPSSSIEEIAAIVLAQARALTGSARGFVSSIDEETGDMTSHTLTEMMEQQCEIACSEQDIVFSLGSGGKYPGLWGYALNEGRGFYTNAPQIHPASIGVPQGHIPLRNFLGMPALVGDRAVGEIALANTDGGYCDTHLEAIGRMAKLYALAVQRRRGELALKSSEERYALAQTAASIGSWDWNITTGRLVWSDAIEPMFGLAPGQFEGTYDAFLKCLHPEDRQLVMECVAACTQNGQDYRVEHRIIWPDGTVRWVLETGDVMRNPDGRAVRMLGVVQDITERKQAESEIRELNEELEKRVLARTGELTKANKQLRAEFRQRHRLEREILDISEREQRRIGRELHDSLGQQLTGIAIMAKVLERKLERQALAEASDAKEIASLVNQAIDETRQLSRGLHPVALDEDGLRSALQALAANTCNLFHISCVFRCDRPVPVKDASAAVHLYRIAQEAITNAVRHAGTRNVLIELDSQNQQAALTITNDGKDFPDVLPPHDGIGLQVMHHRAEMIGGVLKVERGPLGGTRVTCTFSTQSEVHTGEKRHG